MATATVFEEALDIVTAALDECRVPWAVTGSFALAYHGIVRATHDIDVKVNCDAQDERLSCVRERLRGTMRLLDETTFRYREIVDVELYPQDGRIDEDALRRRIRGNLAPDPPRELWFVTAEDLILGKLRELVRWKDLKQVDDIRKLVVAQRATLDWKYLEEQLGREASFSKAWAEWIEPHEP